MRKRFKLQTVQIINDFQATALSLPHLVERDVRSLGGGRAVSGAPMVVLGPGSGLGAAGLVGMVPAESLSQAKADTRRCQPLRSAKMPFSIICASVSVTFRQNGFSQGRALKICIVRSPRLMGSMRHRAMRPRSRTLRCRGLVRHRVRRSICFALCSVGSLETWHSPTEPGVAFISPVELRRAFSIIWPLQSSDGALSRRAVFATILKQSRRR
jgi:Glucokinase